MPATNNCPNCAPYECYHICPNSPHFYSPEQERYDDTMDDGSDDHRERYAATAEPSQYYDEADYDDGDGDREIPGESPDPNWMNP